jgi:hypothetical protein
MKEINQLLLDYYNSKQYPRKFGRYSVSDIYKIKKKELTPGNFFSLNKLDMKGLKNIWRGIGLEDKLTNDFREVGIKQERTEDDKQIKIEYKLTDEITLVMKPDFVLDNFVIETKCPNKIYDKVPPWYEYQCEAQYRMLNKDVYLTLINIYDNEYPLLLPIKYEPKEKKWEEIKSIITKFHELLKQQTQNEQDTTINN